MNRSLIWNSERNRQYFNKKRRRLSTWLDLQIKWRSPKLLKRLEKLSNIKQIFGSVNNFLAISENKFFFSWGDNDFGQITGRQNESFICSPQSFQIPIYLLESVNIVSGNCIIFLLSSKPLESEYDKFLSSFCFLSINKKKELNQKELKDKGFLKRMIF